MSCISFLVCLDLFCASENRESSISKGSCKVFMLPIALDEQKKVHKGQKSKSTTFSNHLKEWKGQGRN